MPIKHTRNVFHLAITENTALRVILYVAKDKIDWYNDNNLHDLVLNALYSPIFECIMKTQGQSLNQRQKDFESTRTIQMEGFRIIYRFAPRTTQQTMIRMEKSYTFPSEQDTNTEDSKDEKPTVQTKYKPLSLYPYQLLLSVDDELFISNADTLDAYFTTL